MNSVFSCLESNLVRLSVLVLCLWGCRPLILGNPSDTSRLIVIHPGAARTICWTQEFIDLFLRRYCCPQQVLEQKVQS